ncbi:MAG TPA: hypothetical protein VFD46_04335 [Chryseolinea sp.]|nr:hypothetical protein [Chryseolinea sp.]
MIDSFNKIEYELSQGIDKHSKSLIVANIELFLGYCTRFYDRQFITRDQANKGTLEKFEKLLNEYLPSDKLQLEGMPSVSYCASELTLSPNYFSDLVKKETGKTAQVIGLDTAMKGCDGFSTSPFAAHSPLSSRSGLQRDGFPNGPSRAGVGLKDGSIVGGWHD